MNFPIIYKLLSVIVATLGLAFAASLVVGIIYWDEGEQAALSGWIVSMVVAFSLSAALVYAGRNAEKRLFKREGLTVIGLGWLVASAVGAVPYLLIVPGCHIADAIFESTSGLTTTGASAFANFPEFPHSLLFWRCLSQWIGGLGVVVFFVAILSFLGAGAKILYSRESSASSQDIESGRIQRGVLRIFYLYVGLSIACTAVYTALGMTFFEALCHMFTTLSTGGFSLYGESFAYWGSPALEWACIVFMMIGGCSFFFWLALLHRDWSSCRKNTEVKVYFAIIVVVGLIQTASLIGHYEELAIHESVRDAFFQAVSIMTTTGYATENFNLWPPLTHILLLGLMVIGGCSGSTSGGCKVVRFIIAGKVGLREIEHSYRPNVVRPIKINGRYLDKNAQESALIFLVMMGLVMLLSLPVVAVLESSSSLITTLSSVLACVLNIGPGLDQVGPVENFGFMHSYTKLLLSLLMIMGRLELYAVLVLFVPTLWKRFS